jgi:hypothetical protein
MYKESGSAAVACQAALAVRSDSGSTLLDVRAVAAFNLKCRPSAWHGRTACLIQEDTPLQEGNAPQDRMLRYKQPLSSVMV